MTEVLEARRGRATAPPDVGRPAQRQRLVVGALAVLVLALVSHTLNAAWTQDIWSHIGAIREFAEHGLDARHGMVAGADDDPLLNPYTMAWGLVAGALDLDPLTVLRLAALVNLAALGAGLFAIARRVSTHPHAGPLLVLLTLLAWGLAPWRWAGFYNLNSLGSVLPLVSTAATALGLIALASLFDWLRGGSPVRLVVAGAGPPLVFLVHPMTGAWVALFAAGVALGLARPLDRRLLAVAALAAGVGAVTLAWPYFPVADLLGGSNAFDESNERVLRLVPVRAFVVVPGLVVLGRRLARGRRDPVALGTALVLVVFLAAWALDRPSIARVLPGVVLGAHLALVQVLPRWLTDAAGRLHRQRALAVAVVLAVCAASMASGIARAVPTALLPGSLAEDRLRSVAEPYEPLPAGIGRDDVLLASTELAFGAQAMAGKGLAVELPQPFVDGIERRREREQALRALLDRPAAALGELADAGVEWLVLTPADAEPWAGHGDEVLRTGDLVVIHLG